LQAVAGPAVLVTVARVEGSAPRGTGTKMLVTAHTQHDTIGGGHLELRAVEIARDMLALHRASAHTERFGLGPSLGQCCGGVVWLAFEPVTPGLAEILAALRERRRQDSVRVSALDGSGRVALFDGDGNLLAGSADLTPTEQGALVDPIRAPRAHLVLFGAGHVGAAIVRALAELPCTVTWVDERDDLFPPAVPDNVTVEATDTPEAVVATAPPGASYLVMTHSHALDERLCEAILARQQVGWFGLLGSMTKRRQFEHRLRARGFAQDRVDAMVCPVGLPGIADKAPAVIAASVAAQLLITWEAQAALPDET
jgi:xanthine dehydrogenase accessory factor